MSKKLHPQTIAKIQRFELAFKVPTEWKFYKYHSETDEKYQYSQVSNSRLINGILVKNEKSGKVLFIGYGEAEKYLNLKVPKPSRKTSKIKNTKEYK